MSESMPLDQFVQVNIRKINDGINTFKNKNEIKAFLNKKFLEDIQLNTTKEVLIERFKEYNYVKKKIIDISNEYVYYNKDLEKFYNVYLFEKVLENFDEEDLFEGLDKIISERIEDPKAYKYIHSRFKKLSMKFLLLSKRGGFQSNLMNLNEGVMVANSGDSAQFMFISRAILAGFNTSNVDVRSSRYDAIIDYNGTLLRVQVKGISDGVISFKDRDRGGQGIDHKHERNRGQIITSSDCDIYVAVDKQCGQCYIIPMFEVDPWPEKKKVSANFKDLTGYLENWDVIKKVADQLPSRNI